MDFITEMDVMIATLRTEAEDNFIEDELELGVGD